MTALRLAEDKQSDSFHSAYPQQNVKRTCILTRANKQY